MVKTDNYKPGFRVESSTLEQTVGVPGDIIFHIDLMRRSPDANISVKLPSNLKFDDNDVYINVIGRGETPLKSLDKQYPGKFGVGYERIVGQGDIFYSAEGEAELIAMGLDLRPDNGTDVIIRIHNAVFLEAGSFKVSCSARAMHYNKWFCMDDEILIRSVETMTGFRREQISKQISDGTFDRWLQFYWPEVLDSEKIELQASVDQGKSWENLCEVANDGVVIDSGNLCPDVEYWFRLNIKGGKQAGLSNIAKAFIGPYNVRVKENALTDGTDAAPAINRAIDYLNSLGGGTLLLEGGVFSITTIFVKSNVHILIGSGTEIHALPGCSHEEKNWFTDQEYRSEIGCSESEILNLPDNWVKKQDEGHSFWQNALFYGQRVENIKIIGGCSINGMGVLTRENDFASMPEGYHADKVFSFKLCKNVEVGGLSLEKDLWYEEKSGTGDDEPFYLDADGSPSALGIDNMMRVTDGGHFVLLATGVDGLCVHDLYTTDGIQIRDILDLMGCNDVVVCNIYTNTTHDDIVKLGSDCALGFTRTSENYIIRNIIADTGCNVIQIGSETADDISDICVDNIYVLAAGKAGFSASINDGARLSGLHLNCGGTVGKCICGTAHRGLSVGYVPASAHPYRTIMKRTRSPFILTLSNRSRVIGAESKDVCFVDKSGVDQHKKLVSNVCPGSIDHIYIAHMDATESYEGSRACNETDNRWPEFRDQNRTTPVITGVMLPEELHISFPDGSTVSKVSDVILEDIHYTAKGGNPPEDAENAPPEQYGDSNGQRYLARDNRGSTVPAYGCYIRHAENVTIRHFCIFSEKADGRYPIVFDDVSGIRIENAPEPVMRNQV